jgi:hypothetical protein
MSAYQSLKGQLTLQTLYRREDSQKISTLHVPAILHHLYRDSPCQRRFKFPIHLRRGSEYPTQKLKERYISTRKQGKRNGYKVKRTHLGRLMLF